MKGPYRIPDGRTVRVAVSGKSGCGNTTVSALLARALGVTLVNYTFRSLAGETGLSLAEILERARTDDSFDRTVDERQVELAERGSCVLGSRLAIWVLKCADLKVYLDADAETRAARILRREGGTAADIRAFTLKRDAEDSARYRKLYGIDTGDYAFADMVVDAAAAEPEQIVLSILEELARRNLAAPA
jgi:cytidylate kinase